MSVAANDRLDARLVVGVPGGARSNTWRIWSQGDEIYVLSGGMGGVEKLSFHSSGICRKAFTSDWGAPPGLADRATVKWKRNATPPVAEGTGCCVLEVQIATDYLSTGLEALTKKVIWIEPAPSNRMTVLEMFFTRHSDDDLRSLASGQKKIVVYHRMPNGEAFAVVSCFAEGEPANFYMPASLHESADLIFTPDASTAGGRPIRITVYKHPRDGDRMTAWEWGGYKGQVTAEMLEAGMGVFRRDRVFDKSGRKQSKKLRPPTSIGGL